MPSKALEMGVCFHRGPVLGNMGGQGFREKDEISVFISRIFIEEFVRHVKKAVVTEDALHRVPRWGTWRGLLRGR